MAYPRLRSCNNELDQGMTDGSYKMVVKDRGGVVEPLTYENRRDLTDGWYGIHEAPVKMTPDGMRVRTPYCVSAPEPNLDYF